MRQWHGQWPSHSESQNGRPDDGKQSLRSAFEVNTIRPNNHADGFGFGGEVRIEQGGDRLGSLGDFGWYGLATTFCKINRSEGVVALCLTQHLPIDWHFFRVFSNLYYQALE